MDAGDFRRATDVIDEKQRKLHHQAKARSMCSGDFNNIEECLDFLKSYPERGEEYDVKYDKEW